MTTEIFQDEREELDAMEFRAYRMGKSNEDLRRRLDRLEHNWKAGEPEPVDPEAEARKQEAEDERSVKELMILAGDDYEAKKQVYRCARDAKLSPEEAKAAFQQNQEDEAWAADMQKLAEGTDEEKREVYRKQQEAGLTPEEVKKAHRQTLGQEGG